MGSHKWMKTEFYVFLLIGNCFEIPYLEYGCLIKKVLN